MQVHHFVHEGRKAPKVRSGGQISGVEADLVSRRSIDGFKELGAKVTVCPRCPRHDEDHVRENTAEQTVIEKRERRLHLTVDGRCRWNRIWVCIEFGFTRRCFSARQNDALLQEVDARRCGLAVHFGIPEKGSIAKA